jgi:predicted glycosyltransferase
MEILSLQKKSILIPTPGQPEQEYLAKKLVENHLAYCCSQESFSLLKAWNLATSYPFASLDLPILNEKVLIRLLSGT